MRIAATSEHQISDLVLNQMQAMWMQIMFSIKSL